TSRGRALASARPAALRMGGRRTDAGGILSAPRRPLRRRRARGRRPPGPATARARAPSTPPGTAPGRERCSLGPRSRLDLGDEIVQAQAARRLDLADARQELRFVEGLARPLHDFWRDRLPGDGFRLVGGLGFPRLLLRGAGGAPTIIPRRYAGRERGPPPLRLHRRPGERNCGAGRRQPLTARGRSATLGALLAEGRPWPRSR